MADHLAEEEQAFRFAAALLTGFAILTFALSAAGLHGLVSYMIVLRRRELALRCALGAPRARLFRSLVTSALRLGVTGTAIGLVASRASANWLGALLYGVDPHAPGVYVLAAGAMLAIVALAAAGSAAAIRRVNPGGALAE